MLLRVAAVVPSLALLSAADALLRLSVALPDVVVVAAVVAAVPRVSRLPEGLQ